MGAETGAEVWLDRAPLKYSGLSYTEIWISEAQERMVLAVPPDTGKPSTRCAGRKGSRRRCIGRFTDNGRLVLKYHDEQVADLSMDFLHDGRPPVVREATYTPPAARPLRVPPKTRFDDDLKAILGSLNVCSKEWVIRQYDHEVQSGSVIKPLVGVHSDGPSDAAIVRPDLRSLRGVVIACGMNPRYGDFDPYWMAASAIDEAVRNCVAVGADPGADRDPRQFLLGQHRAARGARQPGAGRARLPRRGRCLVDAVHQRQRQPEQRILVRRFCGPTADRGDSAVAVDQRAWARSTT